MSEQNDLLNDDAGQQKKDLSAEESISFMKEPGAAVSVNEDIAGEGIAAGEIRAVEPPPKQKSSSALAVLLLFLGVLFAGGYYLWNGGPETRPPANGGQLSAVPKRYPIDKQVTVEIVEQQPVAAVKQAAVSVVTVKSAQTETAVKEKQNVPPATAAKQVTAAPAAAQYQVLVGPFLNKATLEKAAEKLKQLDLQSIVTQGRGPVSMTRLLEGIYLRDEGRERIKVLKKKLGDAFLLPAGDKLALYVGSFTDAERAAKYVTELTKKGVAVTPVISEVEMSGKMLVAMQGEQQLAKKTAAKVTSAGLSAQVRKQ